VTDPFGNPLADPFNPMQQDDSGPSTVGYWIGAILIIGGVVLGVWWGWSRYMSFQDTIDDFERVPVGQVGRVHLDEGDYVVYAEAGGGEPLALVVGNVQTRPPLEFQPYTSQLTYDFGGRVGHAQLTTTVEQAGRYRVRAQPLDSATSVAFGPSVAGDLVSAIVGGLVIGGVGILLGIIFLVVTGRRRGQYRRRNWLAGLNPSGVPPPSGWTPPPPPPI
jgi:hypothetical protein